MQPKWQGRLKLAGAISMVGFIVAFASRGWGPPEFRPFVAGPQNAHGIEVPAPFLGMGDLRKAEAWFPSSGGIEYAEPFGHVGDLRLIEARSASRYR